MKTPYIVTKATLLFVFTVLCTVFVNSQSFQWAKKAGGNLNDVGMAVAVDGSSNVYMAGYFAVTAGFDYDSITSAGNHDVFVAKYNEYGTVQWVHQAGGGGEDIASDINTDANGNIYVTGYYTGAAIFGDDTLISLGAKEIFIAKYTSNGTCEWAVSAGGIYDDESNSICIDAAGNIYITGYFSGSANFGDNVINSYGATDIFVAKFNTDGIWQWAQRAGSSNWDNGIGISIDDSGNLYLNGYFSEFWGSPAHFGNFDLYSSGSYDAYTAKCDNSGNFLWAVKGGGTYADIGNDIITDASGNSFVTGYFSGTATFGTQTLTSDGPDDYFIAKYDTYGNLTWLRQAGGTGYFKGNGISIDRSNNVFLTGTFDGTAVFGDTTLTSMYVDNVFILKYDNNGNFYWAHSAKGSYYHIAQDVRSLNGDAFITGTLFQNAWFDCFFIYSEGSYNNYLTSDIFLAKLNDFINTSTSISSSPFCPDENVSVPFTANYDFDPSNVFTAQLSDLTGCFDDPVTIGTLTGTGSGIINATIPQNTATGTTYRIRVISSNPYIIGSDNGSNLTVNPAVIAEAGADTTINPGESVQIGSALVTGYTYSWSPITGLSDPAIANPVASPVSSTTYYLTVTDIVTGCSDWDSVRVTIIPIAGTSCENAIEIYPDSTCKLQTFKIMDSENEIWLKFIADSSYTFISIINSQTIPKADIRQIYLYNGGCNFLNLLQEKNKDNGDSLRISFDNFIIGETYYIKLMRVQDYEGYFDICLKNVKAWDWVELPYQCPVPCFPISETFCCTFPGSTPTIPLTLSCASGTTNLYLYYSTDLISYYFITGPISCSTGTYNWTIDNSMPGGNYCLGVSPTLASNVSDISFNVEHTLRYIKIDAGPDQTICQGESVTLTGNDPCGLINTFNWSNGAVAPSITVTPATTTTYYLGGVFTFNCGSICGNGSYSCSSSNMVTVYVNPNPPANAGADQTICTGQTAYLSATGGTSYQWSTGASIANISVSPTVTTTYTVTVTNNGCTASDAVTVFVGTIPNANAGADQSICSGTTATLTASGGGAYFLWNTGAVTASINVTPTTTTTYTVTVTNAYGCSASDDVTVTVIISPSSTFTVNPEPACMGSSITFQYTGISYPWSTYNWSFNDNTTATGQTVNHIFQEPGYYNVTLQVITSCGTACSYKLIKIIPSENSPLPNPYNINCCSETQITYTINIPGMTYDATTGNFTVQAGTCNINSGTAYIIKGTIIVPANAILNINTDAIVQFGPLGKIIVERGGKLNLIDCTLRGLIDCITMWQGIEVWGNSSLSQANQNDHGYIYIDKEAIIRDAHTAVLLGKTKLSLPNACTIPTKKIQYDLGFSGGIVNAKNSSFNNNAISVKFLPYKYINQSNITNCNFNGGTLLDPGYLTGNSYTYSGIDIHNPYYPKANTLRRSVYGMYLWNVRWTLYSISPGFDDNNFDNIQYGIESTDSRYSVTSTSGISTRGVFNNMDYGIRIFNTTSSINNGHYIYNNRFKLINNAAVYIDGAKYWDKIENNKFGDDVFPFETQDNKIGIYLKNSYAFQVYDNTFTHLKIGLYSTNNYNGSGLIAKKSTGNDFNGCYLSIFTYNKNNYLKIKCNNFNFNNLTSWPTSDYQFSWLNAGKLADQGALIDNSFPSSEWTKFPAGNMFDYTASVPLKLLYNQYLPPTYINYYRYYYHDLSSPTALKPILAPVANNYLQIVPDNINYNGTSCDPIIPLGNGDISIEKLNNSVDSLGNVYNLIKDGLDHGNTSSLISAINSNSTSGQLKNVLVSNSPLSDEVLITTITTNRAKPLTPGNFKEIIIPNSPVSDTVRYYLDEKVKTLPSGIAKQITSAQGDNPEVVTLTSINRMIDQKEAQKQIVFGEYIPQLVNNDSLEKALDILNAEGTVTANQAVLATYIDEGNNSEAQMKISEMQSNNILTDWLSLSAMLVELNEDSSTVFEIDSTQEQLIRTYAYNETEPLLASNAQAILRLVYGEEFPLEIPEINSPLKITEIEETSVISDTIEYLGDNIPNPFSNTTQIPYYMPDNYNSGKIIIYDLAGQKINEYALDKGENMLDISLDGYNSGIYFYSLNFDGIMYQHKKMICIKSE